jgi:hypothetical protein
MLFAVGNVLQGTADGPFFNSLICLLNRSPQGKEVWLKPGQKDRPAANKRKCRQAITG